MLIASYPHYGAGSEQSLCRLPRTEMRKLKKQKNECIFASKQNMLRGLLTRGPMVNGMIF